MGRKAISKYAVCPFYRHESPAMVYCENTFEQGAVLHIAFAERSSAFAYKQRCCRDKYSECELYKMLNSCYERESL